MTESILLTDDDIGGLTLMKLMLERGRFEVRVAKDAQDALDQVEGEAFSLIITDIMMPGMDGLTFSKILRSQEKTMYVPILILSSNNDRDSIMRGLEAGADDFLPKPILHHDLIAKVRSIVTREQHRIHLTRMLYTPSKERWLTLLPIAVDTGASSDYRMIAIRLLARHETAQFQSTLLMLTEDQDVIVRKEALQSLAYCFSEKTAQILFEHARSDKDAGVRVACVQTMVKSNNEGVFGILKEIFRHDHNDAVRVAVLQVLSQYPLKDVLPIIKDGLMDESNLVRLAAADRLLYFNYHEDGVWNLLKLAITNDHLEVRLRVVEYLERNDFVRAIGLLKKTINDAALEVRIATIKTLSTLNLPSVYRLLEKALSDEAIEVRKQVISHITKFGRTKALKLALIAMQDQDKAIRLEAINAISVYKGKPTIRFFKKALQDIDEEVRQVADKHYQKLISKNNTTKPKAPLTVNDMRSNLLTRYISDLNHSEWLKRGTAVVGLAQLYQKEIPIETLAQEAFWHTVRHMSNAATPEEAQRKWGGFNSLAYALTLPLYEQNIILINLLVSNAPKNEDVYLEVIRAVGLNRISEVYEHLIGLASSERSKVRRAAIEALGYMRDSRAIELLSYALDDKSASVALATAKSLATIGTDSALSILQKRLYDNQENIRVNITEALNFAPKDGAIELLREAIQRETSPKVLSLMIQALHDLDEESASFTIENFRHHESDLVRRTVERILIK